MINKIKDSIITIIIFAFDSIGIGFVLLKTSFNIGAIFPIILVLIIGEAIDLFLTEKLIKGDK